jgi:methylthioribose-1-phosphate isomerase
MPPLSLPETVRWTDDRLWIIDQTLLPGDVKEVPLDTAQAVWHAIQTLMVRGAPAIGVAAAYGLCVAIRPFMDESSAQLRRQIQDQAAYLTASRPTAVNLQWALDRMMAAADQVAASTANQVLFDRLLACATAIHADDQAQCLRIGQAGLPLIRSGMGILTHCNAGALATTGLGTATAPLYVAHQQGIAFRAYADETRPLLQGARLTSWELQQAGIDVTLQTDNMAAHLMSQGLIDMVIVGTDRVAANGDIANKIGTLSVAINARHFGIPFYVAFPSSTVDLNTACGADIVIEEREADEVTGLYGHRIAPANIKVRNPAFDVTPAALITGFITDQGLLLPPFDTGLQQLFGN